MEQGARGVHDGEEPCSPFRLKADGRLRQELAYCAPLGLPHSEFLSWNDDDQDKALAWVTDQAELCAGGCGTRASEWDPKQGGHRFAYITQTRRCPGCELIDMAQQHMREHPEQNRGMLLGLLPNPDKDAIEQDDGGDRL